MAIYRSEAFNMDQYQDPVISDNHYEQVPSTQQSQSMMSYETAPQSSPSTHEEMNMLQHESPQMPVNDAMSNLNLENQIPSTSGGNVDGSGTVRMTRARTRGEINL